MLGSDTIRVPLKDRVKALFLKSTIHTLERLTNLSRLDIVAERFVHRAKIAKCRQIERIDNRADGHQLNIVTLPLRPVDDVPYGLIAKNGL